MRRALYSPGSSHEGFFFVSPPERDGEENLQLTLARVRGSDWQTLSFFASKVKGKKVQGTIPTTGNLKNLLAVTISGG